MDPRSTASRLSLLGTIDLLKPDGTSARSVLAQPKRVALLAFLRLSEGGGPVTRDAVLSTFWPELPEERALNSLRQGLHFLRRSLGSEVIQRTGDHLLHVPVERLWCDAAEIERLADDGQDQEVLDLYGGSFLDGLPIDGPYTLDDWIERTRRRLRDVALGAASRLSEAARVAGQSVSAADWARRLIDLDPLEESGAALLIEAYISAGDPVAAVRSYHEYAEHLERELGLRPSATLTQRVERLETERISARAEEPSPVVGDSSSVPNGRVADPGGGADPEEASPAVTSRRAAPFRAFVATVSLGSLVALAWLGPRLLADKRPAPPSLGAELSWTVGDRPSVAVLPFANHSADSSNGFFAAGVHESLLVTLSKIGSLDVTGLQAVRTYASTDLPIRTIAEELSVSSVMSGSVQRDAGRVRIIVELVDPRTGTQLWSEVYERPLDDVFRVQSEIAQSVASSLSTVLTPAERDRISHSPTDDLEALDSYMRGRQAYGSVSLAGMNEAIGYYQLAVEADPGFAAAWAGIADALLQRVQFFGYPLTWADSAAVLVERAIGLDPELPEAYKTLGFVHSVHGRQRAALDAAERALELRPAYANALNNAGWSRYFLGDVVGAEQLIGRAFRLEPTVLQLRSNVGAIWAALGRVDDAAEWLDGVLLSDPAVYATRTWRTFVDLQRGDSRRALERAQEYLRDETPRAPALARAAFAALLARDTVRAGEYAAMAIAGAPDADVFEMRRMETIHGFALIVTGDHAEGEGAVRRSIEAVGRAVGNGADGWDPPWELASAHAALNDHEATIRHLERAIGLGFPHAVLLRLDPTFDSVRSDPRFDELVLRAERRLEEQRRLSRITGA